MTDQNELENDVPAEAIDVISAMLDTERQAFVDQLGDDRLNSMTAKEWAGFASMYLLEATNATPSNADEGYTKELIIKQRHLLLKALAITNEAIRRHMKNTGFPLFATADLKETSKAKGSALHIVGKARG